MADGIDWSVSSHIRPPSSSDVVAPLTAFANMQLAQSRAQEVQAQLRQQNAQFASRNQLQEYINQGMDLPTALVKSNYGAYDPGGAAALQNASRQQVEYLARQKYANTGDINALAPIGAGEVETASKIPQTQQAIQVGKTNAVGNIATGFLVNPTEDSRAIAVSKLAPFGINDMMAHQLMTMPLDQFTQIAKNYAGMGAESVTTSGIAEANKLREQAAGQVHIVKPGEYPIGGPAAQMAAQSGGGTTSLTPSSKQPQPGPVFVNAVNANPNGYSPLGLVASKLMESGTGAAPNVNPQTKGPAGPLQFDAATWQRFGDGDLKNRFDLSASLDAAQRMAAANKPVLAKILGRDPTDAQLYVGHQQGVAGGPALYANPNARAVDVLSAAGTNGFKAVVGNGGRPDWTAKQFTDFLENRFNSKIGATGSFAITGQRPGGPVAPVSLSPEFNQALPPNATLPAAILAGAVAPQEQGFNSPSMVQGQPPLPTGVPAPATVPAIPEATVTAAQRTPPAPGVTAPATGLAADRAASPLYPPAGLQGAQAISGLQPLGRPGLTIEQEAQQRSQGELNVKQTSEAREAFMAANNGQYSLQQLDKELDKIPPGGGKGIEALLAPGTGATERIGLAKWVNTAAESAGLKLPFDPAKISAAENSQKITGRLGFELSRSLGAREAAQIVQQSISLNPGLENTPQGAKLISASLNAALQRQKDFYVFQREYAKQNGGSPQDAEIAFDRIAPVGRYVTEAEDLTRVKQQAVELLRQHASDPRASVAFDRTYGANMSRYFVGMQ